MFDVQFSEPVSGLTASGLTTFGSTAGGTLVPTVTGSGASYRVEVTGMTTPGTVVLSVLADSAFSAADGEGNTRSTSTDNEVTYAPPAPTVTVEQAAGQADPALEGPIRFEVVFDQAVSGLTGSDFSLAGSTAGGKKKLVSVSGSGTTYTATVSGMTTPGTVVLSLPGGAATSTVTGLGSAASTSTDNAVEWLPPAPVVVVEQDLDQSDPATAGPIVFDVQFSETVSGLISADLSTAGSTAGGTLVVEVTGSGAAYTARVSGMTTPGTVVLSLPAGSAVSVFDGEANLESTSTDNVVTYAPPAPRVTVTQAASQPDPTSTGPIRFEVVFDQAVSGLTGSDFSTAGSSAGGTLVVSLAGSGTTFTVSVSGMTTPGSVVLSLPAGAATSTVTSLGSAASTSTDNSVAYAPPPPRVTVTQAVSQPDPTSTGPIRFDVRFSEAVTGLQGTDFSTAGSTAGGTLVVSVVEASAAQGLVVSLAAAGSAYTASVSGMTSAGTVVLTLPAGAVVSAVTGLGNVASTSVATDDVVTYAPVVTGPETTTPGGTDSGGTDPDGTDPRRWHPPAPSPGRRWSWACSCSAPVSRSWSQRGCGGASATQAGSPAEDVPLTEAAGRCTCSPGPPASVPRTAGGSMHP